jgi:hypothetical protein
MHLSSFTQPNTQDGIALPRLKAAEMFDSANAMGLRGAVGAQAERGKGEGRPGAWRPRGAASSPHRWLATAATQPIHLDFCQLTTIHCSPEHQHRRLLQELAPCTPHTEPPEQDCHHEGLYQGPPAVSAAPNANRWNAMADFPSTPHNLGSRIGMSKSESRAKLWWPQVSC